jgi:hypothetical protein
MQPVSVRDRNVSAMTKLYGLPRPQPHAEGAKLHNQHSKEDSIVHIHGLTQSSQAMHSQPDGELDFSAALH